MNNPKIVVLDGYTLNPGDLSWNELKKLGSCQIYDRTTISELPNVLQDADIVLTNKVPLARDTLQETDRLKYIGVLATGYDVINTKAAREKGIVVTNVPNYGTASVAQMVFAHILNLTQRVGIHSIAVKNGEWSSSLDWSFTLTPQIELKGLVLGIVGFGRIGKEVAAIARGFGMRILATSRSHTTHDHVTMVDLDSLLSSTDFVTLHCPLTDETKQIINSTNLAKMKSNTFLINTGRGGLVDENALAFALNSGQIAGAGLDVLSTEPPSADNPLIQAKNCYITPHISWATTASRQRLLDCAVKNVESFLAGTPTNVVS